MATLLDWSQVKKKVTNFKENLALEKESEAFIYYVLDRILKIDIDEISACITDGGNDRGIDAIFIEDTSDKKVVHLFQMKCFNEFISHEKNFPASETNKVLSFMDDLLRQRESMRDTCNDYLYAKVEEIWEALNQEPYDFEVHLCSNGQKLIPKNRDDFLSSLKKYHSVRVLEHDLEALASIELGSFRAERSLSIRLFEEQNFERTDGFVKGLIGTVKASEFVNFLENEKCPGSIDESLFEENIRLYLGEKNEVNSKIYQSALSNSPAEFWYLNNGITIVCDSYKYQRIQNNAPVHVKNPQIVNGGQTSFSLYQAHKKDIDKLENVRVLVKIIETEDTKFRNKIAEATNSQTPIRSRDLRSNDSIQLKLEDTLRDHGYFYDRKKNQNFDKPYDKRIDALKAGQIIMAYYLKDPEKAKSATDRIFGEYYDFVFDPHFISAEKLLVCHKLYRDLELRRNIAAHDMRTKMKAQYSEAWIIEGIFHALYMIGLLCERDGVPMDSYHEACGKMEEAIQIVGAYVKSQNRASAYRIFRTSKTKDALRNFYPAEQIELPLDMRTLASSSH